MRSGESMRLAGCFLTAFSILIFGTTVLANHPNEGSLGLEELIKEASAQNQEIKAAKLKMDSARAMEKVGRAGYYPEVSVEGGYLTTKFETEKNSGSPVYGKLEWNLYRGGRDQAQSEIREVESALANKQYSLSQARVAREVAKLYYEMLFILESMSLKEKAIDMNGEQMKLAQAKNRSGFTSSADVIEFELREATLRSDLKRLEQERSERSRDLAVVLGRSEPTGDLVVKGHLARLNIKDDRQRVLGLIADSNPELVEAAAAKSIAQKELKVVRSDYFPRLDIEGKYGKLASEERVYAANDNYSAFLKIKIPIFSGFSTSSESTASAIKIQQYEKVYSQKQNSSKAEAEALFSKIASIQERLDLEAKTLSRSEEYYKITLGEYKRGVKNSPDMVGASERLLEARIRNLEFRKELLHARLGALALVGESPTNGL